VAIEFVCYACETLMRAADSAAGRESVCPRCGVALTVPGEPAPAGRTGGDAPALPGLSLSEGPRESLRAPRSEPWFYAFLAGYGWLCLALGVVQFAWVALAAVSAQGTDAEARAVSLVWSGAALLGSLLAAAVAFVLVDVGRTVRARR
jgi:hypothetical protein